jgi:hypothetical protein
MGISHFLFTIREGSAFLYVGRADETADPRHGTKPIAPRRCLDPNALSTANLCRLITGSATSWSEIERHFEITDLNKHWHWIEGLGDSVKPSEAEETLHALIANGSLRSGRKMFLLGEQVTNFVFARLRRAGSPLARDAWRRLPKCAGLRLCTDDAEARIETSVAYYDFVAIPVWHPRILLDHQVRMPPGWQQRMMNTMRAAGGLSPTRFRQSRRPGPDCEKRSPADPRSPIW